MEVIVLKYFLTYDYNLVIVLLDSCTFDVSIVSVDFKSVIYDVKTLHSYYFFFKYWLTVFTVYSLFSNLDFMSIN